MLEAKWPTPLASALRVRQRQDDYCQFTISSVHKASSRLARATEGEPVSKLYKAGGEEMERKERKSGQGGRGEEEEGGWKRSFS